MVQKIIVFVILALAIAFVVVRAVHRYRHRKDNPCGCEGCPGCGGSCAGCKYNKPTL